LNLLLDTHVFLWWDGRGRGLSEAADTLIADPANQVFVSAASVWEIAVKRRLNKLEFAGSPVAAIGANGFHELPILPSDAEAAGALAWRHNDPFDRLLVAQAQRLTLTLLTADSAIRAYHGVVQLWAAA
jgi:PIN domain nuclease of toxin-antitoxin system